MCDWILSTSAIALKFATQVSNESNIEVDKENEIECEPKEIQSVMEASYETEFVKYFLQWSATEVLNVRKSELQVSNGMKSSNCAMVRMKYVIMIEANDKLQLAQK